MVNIIIDDIKNSFGIQQNNLGFDEELLGFINSASSNLVQLGVSELDIEIEDDTRWPTFRSIQLGFLSRNYLQLKSKLSFDPTPSETIARAFASTLTELEGRIANEVEVTP